MTFPDPIFIGLFMHRKEVVTLHIESEVFVNGEGNCYGHIIKE